MIMIVNNDDDEFCWKQYTEQMETETSASKTGNWKEYRCFISM